ncbi:MAG TPA: CDP-glycerol glycerophosphotransferase family protein [Micromonosporaceae bacterium]|nr:CDP-glycerol glycerophosphotransferase family protein [Micromonosporaceae bacterium]
MGVKERLVANAARAALNLVAAVAFVVLALTAHDVIGYVLAGVALAGIAWQTRRGSRATVAPQLLVGAGLLGAYSAAVDASTVGVAVTGALIVLVIANQPIFADTLDRPTADAARLPGFRPERRFLVPPAAIYIATPALLLVLGTFAVAKLPIWPLTAIVAIVTAGTAVVGAQALRVRLHGVRRSGREIHSALVAFDAAFALHFSAPDNTEYHVAMWQPYLERIGRRWIIVARERKPFEALARTAPPGVPVVFCPLIEHVDEVVTPGLRAVFYVNNGMKNSHLVRFHRLTHIQLLHGDSDKASSYNSVTAMFDRIFVAGEAAIDRYGAHGVLIPREKFDIVGRPQVESIKVSTTGIRDVVGPVVLYATTWTSHYADADYCSLPIGEEIVTKLLERGATIILRPHPYADRDAASVRRLDRLQQILAADRDRTGRQHVFGAAATTQMSLFECINRSDAMISDVSGVASDFLYSRKPFALTNMAGRPADVFETSFPLAKAAYVIERNADNLDPVLDDLLRDDPLASARQRVRTYYLGDFPPDSYADGFVEAARRYTD